LFLLSFVVVFKSREGFVPYVRLAERRTVETSRRELSGAKYELKKFT